MPHLLGALLLSAFLFFPTAPRLENPQGFLQRLTRVASEWVFALLGSEAGTSTSGGGNPGTAPGGLGSIIDPNG